MLDECSLLFYLCSHCKEQILHQGRASVMLYSADMTAPRINRPTHYGQSAPLASLSGGVMARKYQAWQGVTGQRYICSVVSARDFVAVDMVSAYSDAIVIVVRYDSAHEPVLVAICDTGSWSELFWHGSALAGMREEGVDEFHIHLIAETSQLRRKAIDDISALVRH
jgi:hypothetical protein